MFIWHNKTLGVVMGKNQTGKVHIS